MFVMGSIRLFRDHTLNPGWFGHPGTTTIYVVAIIEIIAFGFGWLLGWYPDAAAFSHAVYANPAILFLPARLFFVACSVFSIWLTYRLGSRLFCPAAGVVAALMLAVNPVNIVWSQVIRTDIQATMFMLLSILAAVDCLERGQLRSYLWAGAWAGLACVTKWPMVLVASTFVCVGLVRIARRETDARRELAYIVAGLACAAIVALATSPYLLLDYHRAISDAIGEAQTKHVGATSSGVLANIRWYFGSVLTGSVTWLGMLFAMIGLATIFYVRRGAVVLLPFTLIYLVIMLTQALIWVRWVLPVLPVLAILIGAGVIVVAKGIATRGRGRWVQAVAPALTLAVLVPLLWADAGQARERANDTRLQASAWARAHIPDGSSIVLEHLAFDLIDRNWQFMIPAGRPGCVNALKYLKRQVRYTTIEKWRGANAVVDVGTTDPGRLETCRADFAILSHYARYRDEAESFSSELQNYRSLLEGATLVARFDPVPARIGGPAVEVYRLSRRKSLTGP
ncbi:phospholipid carrier-dependent glycosyltransferase [Sphingomonas sp. ABOLD]|nr:phospholipid carrier-dependent glycosyltransferase [Sphingomonas sp. ABOLD]